MNHKYHKTKNQRSGCLMCKSWKINGYGKRNKPDGERFSDHKRRKFSKVDVSDYLRGDL